MATIERKPNELQNEHFDIIVVGGGIYGACMLLEASRRGLKSLLIERDDYGGATSWNSLRIIHGGLRYLQSIDFARFRRSVAEQTWWLKHFPDIVEPMPCLMPLYNRGLRRTSVMRGALAANDILANRIRQELDDDASEVRLPKSKVINRAETIRRFAAVGPSGLKGAAVWWDAKMNSPQRLLMEVLRWSTFAGGKTLNYMKCTSLVEHGGRVRGVHAKCGETSTEFQFTSDHVVNCAGPWAQDVVESSEVASEQQGAIAFNLLVDRVPLSSHAIAVSAKGHTFFCVPHGRQTMIGTVHLPPSQMTHPTEGQLSTALNQINEAIAGFELQRSQIVRVLSGRLPAKTIGSHLPKKSPTIRQDKLGLFTIEGVKYTTARRLAERALTELFHGQPQPLPNYLNTHRPPPSIQSPDKAVDGMSAHDLLQLTQHESVVHIDDLLLRRLDTLVGEDELVRLGANILTTLNWDSSQSEIELDRLRQHGVAKKPHPLIARHDSDDDSHRMPGP